MHNICARPEWRNYDHAALSRPQPTFNTLCPHPPIIPQHITLALPFPYFLSHPRAVLSPPRRSTWISTGRYFIGLIGPHFVLYLYFSHFTHTHCRIRSQPVDIFFLCTFHPLCMYRSPFVCAHQAESVACRLGYVYMQAKIPNHRHYSRHVAIPLSWNQQPHNFQRGRCLGRCVLLVMVWFAQEDYRLRTHSFELYSLTLGSRPYFYCFHLPRIHSKLFSYVIVSTMYVILRYPRWPVTTIASPLIVQCSTVGIIM